MGKYRISVSYEKGIDSHWKELSDEFNSIRDAIRFCKDKLEAMKHLWWPPIFRIKNQRDFSIYGISYGLVDKKTRVIKY